MRHGRRATLLVAFFLLVSAAPDGQGSAQVPINPTPPLRGDPQDDFGPAKFRGAFSKTEWSLSIQYRLPEYAPKTARELTADLADPELTQHRPTLAPYNAHLQPLTTRLGFLGVHPPTFCMAASLSGSLTQ